MQESARRDIALSRCERPFRGYFGIQLQARSAVARAGLRAQLEDLAPGEAYLPGLRAVLGDWQRGRRWPAIRFADLWPHVGCEAPGATGAEGPDVPWVLWDLRP